MYGSIEKVKHNNMIIVTVYGYDSKKYIGYTITQAIKQYRLENNLTYKHICFTKYGF